MPAITHARSVSCMPMNGHSQAGQAHILRNRCTAQRCMGRMAEGSAWLGEVSVHVMVPGLPSWPARRQRLLLAVPSQQWPPAPGCAAACPAHAHSQDGGCPKRLQSLKGALHATGTACAQLSPAWHHDFSRHSPAEGGQGPEWHEDYMMLMLGRPRMHSCTGDAVPPPALAAWATEECVT